jgi:hypothetical protein
MPDTPLLDIPQAEQDQRLAALRRARSGYLLALHVLLLCAARRTPTAMAAFLCGSRSSLYRLVRLYRTQTLGFTVDAMGQLMAPVRTPILRPWLKRSWGALRKRKRLRDLVGDVVWHRHANGPWLYKMSHIYEEPEITAAVEHMAAEAQHQRAACVYESHAL